MTGASVRCDTTPNSHQEHRTLRTCDDDHREYITKFHLDRRRDHYLSFRNQPRASTALRCGLRGMCLPGQVMCPAQPPSFLTSHPACAGLPVPHTHLRGSSAPGLRRCSASLLTVLRHSSPPPQPSSRPLFCSLQHGACTRPLCNRP